MAESEISALRAAIEAEYQASMRGLESYAVVGSHAFINRRFQNLAPTLITCLEKVGPEVTGTLIEEFEAKYPIGEEDPPCSRDQETTETESEALSSPDVDTPFA